MKRSVDSQTELLINTVAEILDPAVFNRGPVNRTEQQLKDDWNRETRARSKARKIIKYFKINRSVFPDAVTHQGVIEELIARRKTAGLNQRMLGISMSTEWCNLSNWERKKTSPRFNDVIRWADALDCDVVLVPRDDQGIK